MYSSNDLGFPTISATGEMRKKIFGSNCEGLSNYQTDSQARKLKPPEGSLQSLVATFQKLCRLSGNGVIYGHFKQDIEFI